MSNEVSFNIKNNCIRLISYYHPYQIFLNSTIYKALPKDYLIVIELVYPRLTEELVFDKETIIPANFDHTTVDRSFDKESIMSEDDICRLCGIREYSNLPVKLKYVRKCNHYILFKNNSDFAKFKIKIDEKYI